MFPDKSHVPQDVDLARILGRTKHHWDNLRAHALDADPAATPEWKFYSQKSGWTFLLRGKRRNVLYMRPSASHSFTVTIMFGKKAAQAAEQSDLPDHVVEMIRLAPQYPEGRAVRIEVTKATDVKIAKRLLAMKMDS